MGVITSSTEDMELVNISKSSLCSGCVSVHCVLQSHLWKEFCVLWHIFAHYFPQITLQATEREKTLKQYIYYMILHGQNIMILYGQNIYIIQFFPILLKIKLFKECGVILNLLMYFQKPPHPVTGLCSENNAVK